MKHQNSYTHHPFLALCLSMACTSVAVEAVHFTDGRLSAAGSGALMGVPAGLVLYCVVYAVNRRLCNRFGKLAPLGLAAFCLVMLPFAGSVALSAAFGVVCGLFLASSLTAYLPWGIANNRMLKIGLSAGIFTTAVYPFGVVYTLLSPNVAPSAMRAATFLFLAIFAVAIYFLRRDPIDLVDTPNSQPLTLNSQLSTAPLRLSPAIWLMAAAAVVLATFNHLLNSGVLEQNGGTPNAPLIFFVNVALRLPMGALIGYWADRERWHWSVGFPLMLMIGACAVSLFAGEPVGDYAMLSAFNCGGAAIVMLIHTLGMQTSLWRNRNAVAACFGSLTHFTLVAYFNINTLGISPEVFGSNMRQPLTFGTIIVGLPSFWLIMQFLANERLRETVQRFFVSHADASQQPAPVPPPPPPSLQPPSRNPPELAADNDVDMSVDAGLTQEEKSVALLLIEGETRRDISRKLRMSTAEVNQHLTAIRGKVDTTADPPNVIASIAKEFGLTRREAEMLGYLRRGMSNSEIAADLYLTEDTVRVHIWKLLRKIKIANRSDVKTWIETFEDL